MEVTFLGVVAVIVTFAALMLHQVNILLFAAVFFSGFTGASVINIGRFSLQPAFYYFILYFLFSLFTKRSYKVRLNKLLIVFFVYCVLSITTPMILGGSDIILMGQAGKYIPLRFSGSNIIHIGYLFFDLLFLNALLRFKNDAAMGRKLLKVFKWGFYAVVLVCLYQLVAFRLDLPFDALFRQGIHGNVQGTRLYGPCIEASMLCYYLVPAIFVTLQNSAKWWEYIFVGIACVLGISSMSSTFLIGIILVILCEIPSIVSSLCRPHTNTFWVCVMAVPLIVVLCLFAFGGDFTKIFRLLFDKLNQKNVSGMERTDTLKTMTLLGVRYPFGLGFGSSRSNDLFSTWLCNVGVVGMCIYLGFLLKYALEAAKKKRLSRVLPFLITNLLMMISVPEPYNLFVWFLLFYGYMPKEKAKAAELSVKREKNARLVSGKTLDVVPAEREMSL